MVDFKKVKAPNNTITRNPAVLSAKADNNIYEAVAVIAKRSNQIAVEMKEELSRKLQEFASYTDNLEEIFENREQMGRFIFGIRLWRKSRQKRNRFKPFLMCHF